MENDNYIHRDGKYAFATDANWIQDKGGPVSEIKLGLLSSDLKQYAERGSAASIVEFYKIVQPSLIMAKHLFMGVSRHLDTDGNHRADKDKRVYLWKPSHCYGYDGKKVVQKDVPDGFVFQVFVSPNRHDEEWPEFSGWIDRWCWVKEDAELLGASINWLDRYDEYLGKLHDL